MNKENYREYYIQGSDHYLIPNDIFDELMYEFENWKKQSWENEDRIDKAIKEIEFEWEEIISKKNYKNHLWSVDGLVIYKILEILKGDRND